MKKLFSVLLCVLLTLSIVPAAFAAPAADAPLMDGATLVTFGDSITALSTWPQSVAKNLNMKLVNSGIGGNTTAHGMARFDRDVAAHNPDFVIMCFATNDFYRADGVNPRVDLATYKANLQTFVEKVRNLGAEPILMTPPFISEGASGGPSLYPEGTVNGALDKYVAAMREVASVNGVGLIDIHAVCDNGGYTVSNFLVSDGVHLSSQGNQVYTDTICAFMNNTYRSDASAPRVEQPTAPKAEPGAWTKPIAPTDLNEWLIIYPDTMYGVQEDDGSVSFANTNGMWPEAHYSPTIDEGITAPVKGTYLTIDMEFEAGSNVALYFNGPNPTLTYASTYVSLTKILKAKIPTLQISGDDILPGQSVYTTLPLEDIVPSSFIAADGTVVFTGVKIFVVGAANKKVTLRELSITTTDGTEVPETPVCTDVDSLLPTASSQIVQNNGVVDFAINTDGSLTIARDETSEIAWPSIHVTVNKTIDLNKTPYMHLAFTPARGSANGHLFYTNAYGTTGSIQLSQLVKGDINDFTEAIDVYVDLAKALGTSGVITLTHYELSVYGGYGDALTWTALATAEEYVEPDHIPGDVNGNGKLDTADATAMLRHFNGTKPLDDATLAVADCNGDGNVNTIDVRYILKALVV
ncbi:MAG: hypothetical protein E7553_03145 [Ruminococcaceae bacterium]|nr:hypothetical protein [Oscillospiraceae bacterium]